ncbi:Hypothetical predicted protein [Scomber scombrus]|uniref:Uncharacterized protein n=1 Tax=Scomber scombrus TaxID=13677 RepID=A0AAV1N527_SCOSC
MFDSLRWHRLWKASDLFISALASESHIRMDLLLLSYRSIFAVYFLDFHVLQSVSHGSDLGEWSGAERQQKATDLFVSAPWAASKSDDCKRKKLESLTLSNLVVLLLLHFMIKDPCKATQQTEETLPQTTYNPTKSSPGSFTLLQQRWCYCGSGAVSSSSCFPKQYFAYCSFLQVDFSAYWHGSFRLEMRATSDGLKILIDEAGVSVEVLQRCHILFSSKQLLCKEKQSRSELLLLPLPPLLLSAKRETQQTK